MHSLSSCFQQHRALRATKRNAFPFLGLFLYYHYTRFKFVGVSNVRIGWTFVSTKFQQHLCVVRRANLWPLCDTFYCRQDWKLTNV